MKLHLSEEGYILDFDFAAHRGEIRKDGKLLATVTTEHKQLWVERFDLIPPIILTQFKSTIQNLL